MQLPELVKLEDYGGSWEKYFEALYEYFKQDFVEDRPRYQGTRLALKKHPQIQGKEATFWHFITTGDVEDERLYEPRRCERIRWIKPIIENSTHSSVRIWEETKRRGERRVHLCYGNWEYVVVLAHRGSYILPWTAFYVDQEHYKRKLERRYNDYIAKTAQ